MALPPAYAALAAHDIKNALGSLEARLECLQQVPEKSARAQLHTAWQDCVQLRRRLVVFLTLYGAESGGMPCLVSDESPADLLTRLVSDASHDEAARRISLRATDLTAAPAFWYYDPRLVRLAMDAALHNAFRFASSEVIVGAERRGEDLVLWVEDDGPGLGKVDLSPEAKASTGLGTALCRVVAQAHRSGERHGCVSLQNRPQGGARFELTLPA
ncbi:MAG: sensor histidine kinase [Rhizobacter sp.]